MAGNQEFRNTTRELKLEKQAGVKSGGIYIRGLTVFCKKLKPDRDLGPGVMFCIKITFIAI